MGTSYRATIKVRCWKEHTCVSCGGTFAYLFERKVTGQPTEDTASANARQTVMQKLTSDVDQRPCPTCGLYQPDMVGSKRAWRHTMLALTTAFLLALLLVFYATEIVSPGLIVWIATGVAAVAMLGHLLTDLLNPNSNLEANQHRPRPRFAGQTSNAARPAEASRPAWR